MLDPIKYQSKIILKDIPIQWIPRFELYYSDLPQFPITYVHFFSGNTRVYGFPASIAFEIKDDKNCDVEILFLSNINLENSELKKDVENELSERFGIKDKVGIEDIISACNGRAEYETFFTELWKYISNTFGKYIPYGKLYEEIFSIVRFVSAWQPKTGRQSEMRMLYNFLSIFGEPIVIEGDWSHLEFFLMPNYVDVKTKRFSDFPEFAKLFAGMEKIWSIYYVNNKELGGTNIRSMEHCFPQSKDNFIEKVTLPLFNDGKISIDERMAVERLVDAFNRHSWRAAFFIWSIMEIYEKDYYEWDKDFFVKFYLNKNGVGMSEKVVACFLQQGFKKSEVIPIDIWIQSFHEHAMGIPEKIDFFTMFSSLGKLERMIWLASQANKTNIKSFFDILWCTRFGDTGNNELRGANPIACYECKLRMKCPSYNKIKNKNVLVRDKKQFGEASKLLPDHLISEAEKGDCFFVCITENNVPKKIYMKRGRSWKLVDEFSGYLLTNQKVANDNCIIKVSELIAGLPSFF